MIANNFPFCDFTPLPRPWQGPLYDSHLPRQPWPTTILVLLGRLCPVLCRLWHLFCFTPNCTRSTHFCLCWWSSPRPFSRARGQMLSGPGSNSMGDVARMKTIGNYVPFASPWILGTRVWRRRAQTPTAWVCTPTSTGCTSVSSCLFYLREWLHLPQGLWGLGKWVYKVWEPVFAHTEPFLSA